MTRKLLRILSTARPMERLAARRYRKTHGLKSYNPTAAAAVAARRRRD